MQKKFIYILSCILIILTNYFISYANIFQQPNLNIQAESAILMDANTHTILYAKNIHEKLYPASITKLLTALIIAEHCNLDDTLTFSHNAIYNVESNSSSAGYDVGDTITVKDALYAMLLKSANEVANALAEHCSGSIENFTTLMNEKAKELGCENSHFNNPSGLNDEKHFTCAYDYALIAAAAFSNPIVSQIAGSTYYKLPPSIRNADGLSIVNHHSMLRKKSANYYPFVKGGKTGYTSLAGNTLVTFATNDNLSLISVVLKSKQTHYADTKLLLDYGFNNFKSYKISDLTEKYDNILNELSINNHNSSLFINGDGYITLPSSVNIKDIVIKPDTTETNYPTSTIENTKIIGKLNFYYNDNILTSCYVYENINIDSEVSTIQTNIHNNFTPHITHIIIIILIVLFSILLIFIGGLLLLKLIITIKEKRHKKYYRKRKFKNNSYNNTDI